MHDVEVGLLWAHDGYGSGNMCQLPSIEGDESTKVVTHTLCQLPSIDCDKSTKVVTHIL